MEIMLAHAPPLPQFGNTQYLSVLFLLLLLTSGLFLFLCLSRAVFMCFCLPFQKFRTDIFIKALGKQNEGLLEGLWYMLLEVQDFSR